MATSSTRAHTSQVSAFKVGFRIHDGQRKKGVNTYFLLSLLFESWPQAVHTTHKTGEYEIKKDAQVLMTRTTLATYRFRRTSHRRFRLCRNRVVQRGFGCHGDTVGPNQDSREGDQVLYEFHDGNCRRSALLACSRSLEVPSVVSSLFPKNSE